MNYDVTIDLDRNERRAVQVAETIKSLIVHQVADSYLVVIQPTRTSESGLHELLQTQIRVPKLTRPLTLKESRALNSVLNAAISFGKQWDTNRGDFLEGMVPPG